ncbi:MAG: amidohydrolase family protein, partial [Paracoccaceae bacterium]
HKGIDGLCRLLETGRVWVKLSGLYRLSNAPYAQTDEIVAALVKANPERCLWGSDWPHIMLNGAEMPRSGDMLDALFRVVSDEVTRERILVSNPSDLYRF